MNIKKAFCIEANRVVDIYEARNFFFSENKERKLKLLCYDDICRKEKRPIVIGVNYWKLIEREDPFSNRAHFRMHYQHPHHHLCPEQELLEAREAVEIDYAQNSSSKRRKITNVVNIFTPFKGTNDNGQLAKPEDKEYEEIRKIRSRGERIGALKEHVKNSKTRSRMLQEVVSCFILLSADERKSTYLQIRENQRTYQEIFRSIKELNNGQNNIYFGGARVSHYKKKNEQKKEEIIGYLINFYDPLSINQETYSVSLFISKFKLAKYKYQGPLKKLLEKAATKEISYLRCFFWGAPTIVHERKNVSISIEHFNNLHFTLPPNRRKNG